MQMLSLSVSFSLPLYSISLSSPSSLCHFPALLFSTFCLSLPPSLSLTPTLSLSLSLPLPPSSLSLSVSLSLSLSQLRLSLSLLQ
ncbi:MAG: hypothetical protein MJE68_20850 [Proteobacteria bacterium]|nr:hypothetical protein [Pseudomonadota bacterium]